MCCSRKKHGRKNISYLKYKPLSSLDQDPSQHDGDLDSSNHSTRSEVEFNATVDSPTREQNFEGDIDRGYYRSGVLFDSIRKILW